jgi:hypothetical protein
MSTNEALKFQKFCSLLLGLGAEVVYKTDLSGGFDQCGLSFNDILVLRAAGLVSDSDMLTTPLQIPAYFTYSGKFLLAQRMEEVSAGAQSIPYPLETYVLTPVGKELSRLVECEPNWAYVQQLAAYWKNSKRISLHVAHGFLAHSNGTASWRLLEGIPPHDQQANWVPSAGPIESPIKEV